MGINLSEAGPWDLVAEGYAETTMGFFEGYADAALEMAGLAPGGRLLDLACGPGTLALRAAKTAGRIDAIDFSPEMIAILKREIAARGIDNIEPLCGDGQDLPYDDDSFDAAFSMFGLMFFPDRMAGYAELYRTLRPGGVALVSSWGPLSGSPAQDVMFGAMRQIIPGMPPAQEKLESLENPDYFRAEMERAGFVDVRVEGVTCETAFDSAEDYWARTVRGGAPLLALKASMGEAEWAAKEKIAIEYLRGEIGERRALGARAWLAYGRKAG